MLRMYFNFTLGHVGVYSSSADVTERPSLNAYFSCFLYASYSLLSKTLALSEL